MVKAWDSITELLRSKKDVVVVVVVVVVVAVEDLFRVATVAAPRVGAWPGNRGGLGFEVQKSLQNLGKHCRAGWSYQRACQGAWAVQLPSSSEARGRRRRRRTTIDGRSTTTRRQADAATWVAWNVEHSKKSGLKANEVLELASFGGDDDERRRRTTTTTTTTNTTTTTMTTTTTTTMEARTQTSTRAPSSMAPSAATTSSPPADSWTWSSCRASGQALRTRSRRGSSGRSSATKLSRLGDDDGYEDDEEEEDDDE